MNRLTIFLSFALGCLLSALMERIAIPAHAQGISQGGNVHLCADKGGVLRIAGPTAPCPKGERSVVVKMETPDLKPDQPKDTSPDDTSLDKATLEDLNRRLGNLEKLGCAALAMRKVVAPFEVVDRSGKIMFSVVANAAGLFDGGATPVAAMVADGSGGLFSARGGNARVSFGINEPRVAGISVSESGKSRIELGKILEKSNYSLRFLSGSGQVIAGIGESPTTGTGLVLINDGNGKQRAIMEVTDTGKGRIGILSGGSRPIAAVGEGEQTGGAFYACAAGGGCDPVMVGAGSSDNVGVVATGPRFYSQGLTGAPGSFLVGKK